VTRGDARQPGAVGPGTAVGVAWLVSLGFDVFLHAGVLATLYARPSPFLLPADAAFRRIPMGYASFLLLTAALYWLFRQVGVRDWFAGLRLGLVTGLTVWGAWTLGLYSISVAEGDLLVGWWLGQGAEMGLAGAFLGAAASGMTRRRYLTKAGVVVGMLVVVTVLLQVVGLAPPMKTVN
jgi:hypothetical protein